MSMIRAYPNNPATCAFTLIETLISLGMLATIAAIGFGSGVDGYEREIARSERTSTLWLVLQARADAMNGICVGNDCVVGVAQSAALDATHTVTFAPLSGLVSDPQDVSLSVGSTTSTLSVNNEGRISLISY